MKNSYEENERYAKLARNKTYKIKEKFKNA